jgi:AdoMet-dependent heme synthase
VAKLFYRREPFGAVLVNGETDVLVTVSTLFADCLEKRLGGSTGEEVRGYAVSAGLSAEKTEGLIGAVEHVMRGHLPMDVQMGEVPPAFPTLSYPLDLFWEITRKCNEYCMHCYNNSGPKGQGPTDEQLAIVLGELQRTKLRRLSISGGEPLMRKGFKRFTSSARGVTYEMSLSTNATLIDEDMSEFIAATFDDVNVSLDSPDQAEFDRFRGMAGAFKKTLAGITRLRDRGAEVVIQSVLTNDSINRLSELAELIATLRVNVWNIRLAFASGRGVTNGGLLSQPALLINQADAIDAILHKYRDRIRHISGGVNYLDTYKVPYQYTKNDKRLVSCAGGTTLAALSANGSLAPCPLFSETDFCSDPVWERGLKNAWHSANCMTQMRTTTSDQIQGCGTCSNLNGSCGGGCRAKSYLVKQTIYSNDYHCNYSRATSVPLVRHSSKGALPRLS